MIRRIIETLKEMQGSVTFHWIAVHSGIPGNEEADRLAKEATGWRSGGSGPRAPTYLMKPLASTISRLARNKANEQWKEGWLTARHRNALRATSTRQLQLYRGMT